MKTKISSTSALVLLWGGGNAYTSDSARKFLNMLDLESGIEIMRECNKVWPHYAEIIKNRKSCILDLSRKNVLENEINQVIILGAGLDALSLELCSYSKKCRIVEIDIENMDAKKELLCNISSSLAASITCITMDISKYDDITPDLLECGWNKNVPTLIVIEGLSYYLSKDKLWKIIDKFTTKDRSNRIILEYLLPTDKIPSKWIKVQNGIFDMISKNADLDFISRYSKEDIAMHLKKMGGGMLGHYKMSMMEKERTLQNSMFSDEQDGWIEICEIMI